MTLRKFLRFFKHFPRYMKKDFMWLINRFRKTKDTATKENKRNTVTKENKGIAKFSNKLKQIMKDCSNEYAIRYGNFYYVCFKNSPYEFYKIWKNTNMVYVTLNNKKWTFDIGHDQNTLSEILIKSGMIIDTCGTHDQDFAILLKSKSKLSAVKVDNVYKVYQTCGTQKPRLIYKIDWVCSDNFYYTNVVESGHTYKFNLTYDPIKILNTILISEPV